MLHQPCLSLEAYLSDEDFCIRSLTDGICPLFQLEDEYESENADILNAIECGELDDRIIGLFEGCDMTIDVLKCVIRD